MFNLVFSPIYTTDYYIAIYYYSTTILNIAITKIST